MSSIVLITGATSGFGRSCATLFAEKGHRLILNGRRKDRLEKLANELKDFFGTH
jgi:NADP-dependent 3-hydroxy acid dehydrogenase YdfG